MSEYQSMCQSSCSHNSCRTPCQCQRFCMGLCPFYPPPKPPKPPTPPTPPTPTPSDYVFGAAQFQMKAASTSTISPQSQILFDAELYNSGKFALDVSTGSITITEAGVYKIDYEFDIGGINPPSGAKEVLFALMLNNTQVSLMSCNVGVGQFVSSNIVNVSTAPSVITIKNINDFDILISEVTVKSNITIMRLK